jgi:predicted metalloprotease
MPSGLGERITRSAGVALLTLMTLAGAATAQSSPGQSNPHIVVYELFDHGTADERAAAVVKGFEASYKQNLNLNDAINSSLRYVSTV